MKVDEFGHRFFHIFTYLASEFRAYLVFKDKTPLELVELDLQSSQLTILANIMYDEGISGEWIDTCRNSDAHQATADKFKVSRDEAKVLNMRLLFGKIEDKSHKQFKKLFPAEGEFIEKIKTSKYKGLPSKATFRFCKKLDEDGHPKKQKTNHKSLSCLLQQKESDLFQEIWKCLEKKKIQFIPVHDAVYLQKENVEEAKLIMNTVFKKHLNFFKLKSKDVKKTEKVDMKSKINLLNSDDPSVTITGDTLNIDMTKELIDVSKIIIPEDVEKTDTEIKKSNQFPIFTYTNIPYDKIFKEMDIVDNKKYQRRIKNFINLIYDAQESKLRSSNLPQNEQGFESVKLFNVSSLKINRILGKGINKTRLYDVLRYYDIMTIIFCKKEDGWGEKLYMYKFSKYPGNAIKENI